MSDELIRVDSLSITHRDARRPTPENVSFAVRPGEALLILGPSGCGKSTLSLALNGLVPKDVWANVSGRVTLSGHDLESLELPETSQYAAMVFQDPDSQMVAATVFDEVAFGPENLCVPADEIERRVTDALHEVGLWSRRHDAPELLSGGGRQRLAIAAALAQGAPLIVLDEPTANLDPRGARDVYEVLGRLLDARKLGVVLVEHNLDEALRIATSVLVLDASGHVAFTGSPREVFTTHREELSRLGVWLPIATAVGAQLRDAGWDIPRLPLTISELRGQLTGPAIVDDYDVPTGEIDMRAVLGDAAPAEPVEVPEASTGSPTGIATSSPTGPLSVIRDPAEPILSARNLSIRRGRSEVVHDVSLDIPAGAFVGVVGPNGAGKTTLLQALAGIEAPPRGTVSVDGRDVARLRVRELRDRIGYVFQNPEHQFLANTVRDELSLELRSQGFSDDAIAQRTEHTLERFSLAELADAHPFVLSGGQKRRLSVATALVSGAPVLVLDEPTFGQDQARAAELIEMLAELNAAGTTVIMATHDLQLAAEVTDLLLVVTDGTIAAFGPTPQVLAGDVLEESGLGLPPLATAFRGLDAQPRLAGITRFRDLPGYTPDASPLHQFGGLRDV
ncbi:ABC transporter ATP-binding protein [Gulosibacter molinativorax]|uniref:ABC transporter ATP-binding protein n=1 Tax=Gulosibacter molinativorax TaxID=256821 RepID=A0ABT7C9E8_9MICO|nr:energy-coupling factor transporter ATPase [Gulosibacter molinativorax]MDJ1371367.1 ABC transporter ATP-binding protein [Gulosibacter molinativorax]QUY62864.1 ABC transporter, ATP-binding protein [Gulosibacter molinativorax]